MKYQPSNGTEGEWFMGQFCHKCIKMPKSMEAENQCWILGRTFFYDIDDPKYPEQWQRDEEGVTCTAFKSREEFNTERRAKRKPIIASDNPTLNLF